MKLRPWGLLAATALLGGCTGVVQPRTMPTPAPSSPVLVTNRYRPCGDAAPPCVTRRGGRWWLVKSLAEEESFPQCQAEDDNFCIWWDHRTIPTQWYYITTDAA